MAPTETQRFRLRVRLGDWLEEEDVTTLMDSLPPVDWKELATKTDLALLKDDLAALEERVNAKFEVVDARFDALRVELGAKIDTGLTEVRGEITEVRGEITEVRGDMKLGLARQTYVILVGMAALVTPIYLALFSGGGG